MLKILKKQKCTPKLWNIPTHLKDIFDKTVDRSYELGENFLVNNEDK